MLCSCSLHLSLTLAFLSPGICFSPMSCLPLLPPLPSAPRYDIPLPALCLPLCLFRLPVFSPYPLFCRSLLLCSSALSATLQARGKKTQQCVSDVLKCSASQWEVTPCKKRHFKKSSGSSKFSTVIGLNSSQIKSLLYYWFSLNMWHNLEQHFNNDTKFWMLDYWSSWIHFHA